MRLPPAHHTSLAVCAALLLTTVALAGCALGDRDALVLAFTGHDDDLLSDKDPRRIAAFVEEAAGRPAEIFRAGSTHAVMEVMRAGQADAAFLDGAAGWFAWQRLGFEAIAADQNADGRTHYEAVAYVRADSPYTSMADLEGARSCHTGLLKSAGMFMPLGWMLKNGLVQVVGAPDDLASIRPTVQAFFPDASIPEDGTPYSGYQGALRCLSEGRGDVAFVKDTTPQDHCGERQHVWCLPADDYRLLQVFAQVPSHVVMVRPGLEEDKRADLLQGLLAMNDDAAGQAILAEVLETPGIVAVATEEHLGGYGANLRHVPGINAYVEARLNR